MIKNKHNTFEMRLCCGVDDDDDDADEEGNDDLMFLIVEGEPKEFSMNFCLRNDNLFDNLNVVDDGANGCVSCCNSDGDNDNVDDVGDNDDNAVFFMQLMITMT